MIYRTRAMLGKILRRVAYPVLGAQVRKRVDDERFAARVWRELQSDPVASKRIKEILALKQDDPRLKGVLTEDERALPSDPAFQATGYYRTMFIRYGVAMHYARGKRVLDTCSGLGWGAYLLESAAEELVCLEIDNLAVDAARILWPYERTALEKGSVLSIPHEPGSFDVVTAMESIEHFTLENARTYVAEMRRVLRPGGLLVGSTPLPTTQSEVEKEKRKNPFHLHVFTPPELEAFLREYFEDVYVYTNQRYFRARKPLA